jgi:tetratricopeptide (TPR) repeat protein
MDYIERYVEKELKRKQAGSVNGKHFVEYVERVKQLKREGKYQEAIELLLKLIDAVESEVKIAKYYGENWFCAPWYYEQLAIIYRKEKQYGEEVAILERLQKQNKCLDEELLKRLKKARELGNALKFL